MTYTEMVEFVAEDAIKPLAILSKDFKSKREQKAIVRSVLDSFFKKVHAHVVVSGGDVRVPGFGKFSKRFYPEKTIKAFGKEVLRRAKHTVKFKPY